MYDIIVIGGGPAGVTAALRARELGARVALVERGRMGGTCTNDGCAPTRVLAKAARLVRDAEQFGDYGLSEHTPRVNLPRLLARTQQTIYRLQEKKQLVDHLRQAGVEVFAEAGEAGFEDATTIAFDGQRLQAAKYVLAVGGHARRLPLPGAEHALTHSSVWSLTRQPRSIAIVGAAATGCQLASIFHAFGTQVHLLEVAPRILAGEDEAISHSVSAAFAQRGIHIVTGIAGVAGIEKAGDGLTLHYTSAASAPASLSVESVLLAVGWVGNLEPLNLPAAGVQTERGYVKVNDFLQTTAAHIFAAGDLTGRMMLVQSASSEARVAADNALLGITHTSAGALHSIVPHGGFTDPEYGSVGLTESRAREALGDDVAVATAAYSDLDRAVIDDRPEGFCKLIISRGSQQLVGAHVVGEQAVEVVQMAAAGMAAGMTVSQLAELELAYPTFTAIIGLAARKLVRDLGLTPLAPAWRTLGRAAEWEQRA